MLLIVKKFLDRRQKILNVYTQIMREQLLTVWEGIKV